MPTSPDWYPADANAYITLILIRETAASGIEEAVTSAAQDQLTYGVRFHRGESNPGYDLEHDIVAELLSDGRGPLRNDQRIEADRLNAAAERALDGRK